VADPTTGDDVNNGSLPQNTRSNKSSTSVAARSRAEADTRLKSHPVIAKAARGNKNYCNNAGVSRGKYSEAQVKELLDNWGKEESSEDEDQEDYEDFEDDYTDEASYESGRSGDSGDQNYTYLSKKSSPDRRYLKSLERSRHHLQLASSSHSSTSQGNGKVSGNPEELYMHYQHHRTHSYHVHRHQYGSSFSSHGRRSSLGSDSNSSNSARRMIMSERLKGGHRKSNINDSLHRHSSNGGDEDSDLTLVGGFFQSAKNWLQSQRDKLARLELERQVEDQRRKLVEEGRKQRTLEAERRRRMMMKNDQNGGIDCDHHQSSDEIVPVEKSNDAVFNGIYPGICGFGVSADCDDTTEYSGTVRVNSAGEILEVNSNDSLDNEDDNIVMKVSSPRNTVSGKGMSVKVDLPDEELNHATFSHSQDDEEDDDSLYINDVKILPEPPLDEGSITPLILKRSQMKSLIASGALPPSLNYCKWKRLYSLARDGDSFDSFLRLVEGYDRTVLVLTTSLGEVFGGYADSRWEARGMYRQANEFYGSAQACLFRFPACGSSVKGDDQLSQKQKHQKLEEDEQLAYDSTKASEHDEDEVIIFKWSGANRYIQLCDVGKRTVAFGGGGDEGVFGLCVEDDFKRGTTGHCATFENDALCENGYFDVVDLEVWGFVLDF